MTFFIAFSATLAGLTAGVPALLAFLRSFQAYVIVGECQAKVFILFGKVIGVIDQPGLHLPIFRFGPRALLLPYFGKVHVVDLAMEQVYLRSQAVNSEEGTPMGIGVWYEMRVSNPVDYLFANSDPQGSLQANVANSTVRSLNNMPLDKMLVDRHPMSRTVRAEVSPQSTSWGYQLGSVYIRKVHFRDAHMIQQIEQKVVNRLRQVTSAISQAGINQVNVITSQAERDAAIEFAKASAMRPQIVGRTLARIATEAEVCEALFQCLEADKIMKGPGELTLISGKGEPALLPQLLAAAPPPPSLPRRSSPPPA